MSVVENDRVPLHFIPGATKFLASDGLQPGADIYPEIFAVNEMFPLQRMKEVELMMREARTVNPSVILAIGVDKCGEVVQWCLSFSPKKMICIEIRGTPYQEIISKRFPDTQFLWLEASSYDLATVAKVRDFLGDDRLDCIFIDGDKLAMDRDFYAYKPLMRSGGIAFFHDVMLEKNHTCAQMFETISRKYTSKRLIDTSEHEQEYQNELAGKPPANSYKGWLRTWRTTPTCGVGCVRIP